MNHINVKIYEARRTYLPAVSLGEREIEPIIETGEPSMEDAISLFISPQLSQPLKIFSPKGVNQTVRFSCRTKSVESINQQLISHVINCAFLLDPKSRVTSKMACAILTLAFAFVIILVH